MDILMVVAMLIGLAMSLSYIVWWLLTDNGLREFPRERRRRRYYIR
jgi:hypothetical protein